MEFYFKSLYDVYHDSFELGKKLYISGFRPNHAISLWRGGTIVGLGLNEFFRMHGLFINHTSISTSSYGDDFQQKEIIVKGMEHVIKVVVPEDKLLIIDDIFDSGNTVRKIIEILKTKARKNMPKEIVVATLERKPENNKYFPKLIYLRDLKKDIWVNYPHEVSDLFNINGVNYLQKKDKIAFDILEQKNFEIKNVNYDSTYYWSNPEDIFYNSLKLAVNIYYSDFEPDYLIALWPGGVLAGVYFHEAFKYLNKKNNNKKKNPDHIAINTTSSHLSYKSNIIGLPYLFDNINYEDKILLIDTVYRSGVHINSVIDKLKEGLRRNLNHKNIRIATLYFNPEAKYTWTTKPYYDSPHYYIQKVNTEIIYPHAVHRLRNPQKEVNKRDKKLYNILWGFKDF